MKTDKIDETDALRLENETLRFQMAEERYARASGAFAAKYKVSEGDSINLQELTITRKQDAKDATESTPTEPPKPNVGPNKGKAKHSA